MSDATWEPHRPTLAGNWEDDDGQVISDLVTTEAAPPDPYPAAATPIPAPSPAPKRPTRLLAGTFIMDPANYGAPSLLLPEDLDRESLTVRVLSDNSTDYVLLGESPNAAGNPSSAHRLNSGGSQGFDDHTGPLWVALPPQPNQAGPGSDGSTTAGWLAATNATLDLVPAPWDATRQAVRATAVAAGAVQVRTPVSPLFVRSNGNVVARVKVQGSTAATITAFLARPGSGVNIGSGQATGQANAAIGWRELVLPATIQTDSQGNVCLQVQWTAAAAGDTVIIGDIQLLDRALQGQTVVSWASVTR